MSLLWTMVKEEYRMHASFSSSRFLLVMPAFVIILSFLASLTLTSAQSSIGLLEMVIGINTGGFLYGISVGAFGFIGRTQVERRQGAVNYLVTSPCLLPLTFRSTFMSMYARDALFYLGLLVAPASCGLLLAAPLAHFSPVSIGFTFLAMTMSFLLGLSLSFLVSVIGSRSRAAMLAVVACLMAYLAGFGLFRLYPIETLLPSLGVALNFRPLGDDAASGLGYLMIHVGLSVLMTSLAGLLVPTFQEGDVRAARKKEAYRPWLSRMSFGGRYAPLLAKEMVDLGRSGGLPRMAFSFAGPLAFLGFTVWYVNAGLDMPVGFNIVFYAAMAGFFSVTLYTQLANLDHSEHYQTMPVNVPAVIRAKLIIFLIATMGISTAFVLFIAFANGQTRLLWVGLPVLYVTSVYMASVTAYLTGLRTNTFLFDPSVLSRFAMLSAVPDLGLTILSFSIDQSPAITAVGIAIALGLMAVIAATLLRRLEGKWASASFI